MKNSGIPFNNFGKKAAVDVAKDAMGVAHTDPMDDGDADNQLNAAKAKPPKGGKFHSMHIEAADNGFTVRTTHKVPRKASHSGGASGVSPSSSYPGDQFDHQDTNQVFTHRRDLANHILGMCKDGDCND